MAIETVKPLRGRLVPHLIVRDTEKAVRFYERAFGAEVLFRGPLPGTEQDHFQVRVNDSVFMVSSEPPRREGQFRLASPETLGGTSVVLTLFVKSAADAFTRAVSEGAKGLIPPTKSYWGDVFSWVLDDEGHIWQLSEIVEELSPDEVNRRRQEFESLAGGGR